MTPYYVEVLMAVHTRGVPLRRVFPPTNLLGDIIIEMINDELIEDVDDRSLEERGRWFVEQILNTTFSLSEKGRKFLYMILNTPQPVSHTEWVDPREIDHNE